jgi:hypothetical protein
VYEDEYDGVDTEEMKAEVMREIIIILMAMTIVMMTMKITRMRMT